MDLTAIVPLKALETAKGRLSLELDAHARQELATWMFQRVVKVCLAALSVTRVLVIAGDERSAAVARGLPVDVALEPRRGLARALAHADVMTRDAPATVVIAADLPLLTPADVDAMAAAGGDEAGIVLAPTEDGGTAGLLRRPGGAMPTAYGPGSAALHRALAAEHGLPCVELRRRGFALDVDTPRQLADAGRSDAAVSELLRVLSSRTHT